MNVSVTVGGARATFSEAFAQEVVGVLDRAFGAEGEWESAGTSRFGDLNDAEDWAKFQKRAISTLGRDEVANILALGEEGRGVFLPAHVRAISFKLSTGQTLRCASLPGLRRELANLADEWFLPLDDEGLSKVLEFARETDEPAVATYARLALASNEAVRRDCPLWLVGEA